MSTLQYDLFLANLNKLNIAKLGDTRVSPATKVFTTADPTTAFFGFCMCKWGIFVLVGDPL